MTAASTPAPAASRLRGTANRRRNERAIRLVLLAAAVVSILVSDDSSLVAFFARFTIANPNIPCPAVIGST